MTQAAPNFPTGDIANPAMAAAMNAEQERSLYEGRSNPRSDYGSRAPLKDVIPASVITEAPVEAQEPTGQLDLFSQPVEVTDELVGLQAARAATERLKARNAERAAAEGRPLPTSESMARMSVSTASHALNAMQHRK